ncbi:hypothetical protein JAO29_02805 [Edaphobacter sp. HDX4]|uniref:hypothetical protein n=1 Tax=Edaphobacter sp. HDX4 TaxID=2794064 RepID=UPI002FE54E75
MKKPTQHLIAEVPPKYSKVELTIGIDLGDAEGNSRERVPSSARLRNAASVSTAPAASFDSTL